MVPCLFQINHTRYARKWKIPLYFPVLSEIAEDSENGDNMSVNGSELADTNVENEGEMVARRERRRKKIMDELFETEKTYLNHLEVAHKVGNVPIMGPTHLNIEMGCLVLLFWSCQ